MTDTDPLDGFTTRIDVRPAYDHRDEPGKGANGAELELILTGPLGAIVSTINTGWVLRPVNGPLGSERPLTNRRDKPGVDHGLTTVFPSGHGTWARSKTPPESRIAGSGFCPYIGEEQCYTDGSFMTTDRVLHALIEGGHQAAFAVLAELYQAWLVDAAAEAGAS